MSQASGFTLEVEDAKKSSDLVWRDLDEFGVCMHSLMFARTRDDFDSARHRLLSNYGVRVTATRTVFRDQSR